MHFLLKKDEQKTEWLFGARNTRYQAWIVYSAIVGSIDFWEGIIKTNFRNKRNLHESYDCLIGQPIFFIIMSSLPKKHKLISFLFVCKQPLLCTYYYNDIITSSIVSNHVVSSSIESSLFQNDVECHHKILMISCVLRTLIYMLTNHVVCTHLHKCSDLCSYPKKRELTQEKNHIW